MRLPQCDICPAIAGAHKGLKMLRCDVLFRLWKQLHIELVML